MLPHLFPEQQFGTVAGIIGSFVLLGNAASLILFGFLYAQVPSFVSCAIAVGGLLFSLLIVVLTLRKFEQPKEVQVNRPKNLKQVWSTIKELTQPLKRLNFLWVFLTRFLMQTGMIVMHVFNKL